jgi:hypothetical protein
MAFNWKKLKKFQKLKDNKIENIKNFSVKCFFGLEKLTKKMMAMKREKVETFFKEKGKSLLPLLYIEVNIFCLIILYEIFITYLLRIS